MEKDYELLWANVCGLIAQDRFTEAKKIWDEIVESAWKYDDLSNS